MDPRQCPKILKWERSLESSTRRGESGSRKPEKVWTDGVCRTAIAYDVRYVRRPSKMRAMNKTKGATRTTEGPPSHRASEFCDRLKNVKDASMTRTVRTGLVIVDVDGI